MTARGHPAFLPAGVSGVIDIRPFIRTICHCGPLRAEGNVRAPMHPLARTYYLPACAAIPLLLLLQPTSTAAGVRDSLAYVLLRDSIAADSSYPEEYREYIEASDELAGSGMHAEAYELLAGLFAEALQLDDEYGGAGARDGPPVTVVDTAAARGDAVVPADSTGAPIAPRALTWHVSMTASYDRFDDSYVTSFDEDSLDSAMAVLDEIDDQPFNGKIRASLDWQPGHHALERFSPFLYLSNTRLRAGLSAAGAFARRALPYAIDVEGEKRLGEDYGDSSDVLKGGLELEPTTRPLEWRLNMSLPVRLETEQYRSERSQYASFWKVRAEPTLELESSDFGKHIALSMTASWQDYDAVRNEDDEACYGPRLVADLFGRFGSMSAQASWVWERYPARSDPHRRSRLDADIQAVLRPVWWLELGLSGSGFRHAEQYRAQSLFAVRPLDMLDSLWLVDETWTVIEADYTLMGYGLESRPSVCFRPGSGIAVEGDLGWEYARYPEKTTHDTVQLYDTLYISESYVAWEPRLTFRVDLPPVYASLSLAYRTEDITVAHYLEDNRALRPSLQLNWRIVPWLTLDTYVDYQYRMFPDSVAEHNVSASVTLRARF